MDKRIGHYLGTEINEKWWKRYTQEVFFARGRGEYWYDETAFYFLRSLTQDPIVIPFRQVEDVKVGTWHCGRWDGLAALRIIGIAIRDTNLHACHGRAFGVQCGRTKPKD